MSAPSLRARAPRAAADSAPAGSSGAIEPPRKRGRPRKVVAAAAPPEDEHDGFDEHDAEDTDMAGVVAGGAAAANGFAGHGEGSADGAPALVVDDAEREVLEKLAVVLSLKDLATILRSCCGFSTTPLSLGLAPVYLHSSTPTHLLSGTDEDAPTTPENVADIGVIEALRRVGLEEQVLRWEGALSWGSRLWEGLAGPNATGPVEDGKKRKVRILVHLTFERRKT
ncbi:hypothetical protein M427DRAFT_259408 [Gonapodya prolifera JEL478]|uniref:Uncharacterized protein n=1 Tax=Gonapodya prolifera (strain JEL478) TaxID=1344416 RepID=A0A139AKM5_GONPJ|nr:hypothetical protein M427DRAFT_259408 [Gonapodya prolifera JEL478]|eukprot:KXS17320.1 hypothetical protein M427DRAFT_259408 [Gonapodya prolifera JEL478]